MRHLFIDLYVTNGEYEYSSKSVHTTEAKSLWLVAQRYASTFYGSPDGRTFGGDDWYFNGGEVAVSVDRFQEITEEEYDILNRFL